MILLITASREQSWWMWLIIVGAAGLIALLLYLLGLWVEKAGHGKRHPVVTRAGGAMLELQSLLEPGKRHVIEAKKQLREEEESGDDDDTSGRQQP